MKEQHGYRYLFKNIGLLTLSSFATKLLSFFLVPLYTSILTTTEYGTYDLFNATIGVLLPILTLNIQESVLRFSLDKRLSKESIVSVSIKYLVISNLIVVVALLINQIFRFSGTVADFSALFFLMFLVQSLSGVMVSYIRGIDKVSDLAVSSVITSVVTIVCNILFLIVFKWGLIGYFVANIIGPASQCIYLIIKSCFLSEIRLKAFKKEENEMTIYSKPLIANSIAWWVNNVSDRYVVVFFCGLAANGVYSVAGKIPAILNIFQNIFNQAWALSAVKDYDQEDKDGFFSNTYKVYNCMMTIICSSIILFDKLLAKILYANDFYSAWQYVPWLTIAILFGALSGYLGGFFTAVKDSKSFATSTAAGAITNIVLNIIFVPIIGPIGAAIATAVCYFEVYVIRLVQSLRYIRLQFNIFRDVISYVLLVLQAITLLVVDQTVLLYGILSSVFVLICFLYLKDIKAIILKLLNR